MDKELDSLLKKCMSVVDHEDNKQLEISKLAVQSYLDNTIWKLFSRTELQNKKLVFNNDQNRLQDKKCLQKLIFTLFEYNSLAENTEFLNQLHDWIVHIVTIYLNIASTLDKKKLLSFFINTPNISPWAIPLIQYKIAIRAEIDDYLDVINIFFKQHNDKWTEDDYLMILDQLAIEYSYNKIVELLDNDDLPDYIFHTTSTLIYTLLDAMKRSNEMHTLLRRIAQSITQIITLLVEATSEKDWDYQDQIDDLLCHLIFNFNDLNQWFLLPNMPFQALSTNALWNVTAQLLQLKDKEPPTSLNDILKENAPNIARFQYGLHANPAQGYFMLTSLTNIVACIPQGVDDIGSANNSDCILSTCIITVISYAHFMTAFVDKDSRELFYKDVRTHLSIICENHTFIISLLFRWTVEYITVMERMSLYLFRAISLNDWIILQDDLKLIHKLLLANPLQKVQAQFAKHILSHLNYNYALDSVDRSKSQPWHPRKMPFLPYSAHEEIAYILVDACQHHRPLAQQKRKGPIEYVVNMQHVPMDEFIEWAWSIAVKLRLYDCPVSPKASDTDQSLDVPYLKRALNDPPDHNTLFIYVSFMLSVTSRHFLRFEGNNGWLKLLVVLRRGLPEAAFLAFSEIVPSFVYMHGDDFFDGDTLVDFLKHLVECKPELIPGVVAAHLWQAHLIDFTGNLDGFSYVDLMLHSWLKTVFRRTDWIWQSHYVCIVDTLCKLAFTLHRQQLVYSILREQHQQMEAIKLETTTSSPRITRLLKSMVVAEGASLLVGEWSLLKPTKVPGVELKYHWFAFHVLMMETMAEKPIRDEMTVLEEAIKPLEYFSIYRWLQHIIALPVDHVLLPLYCQLFFSLYFHRLDDQHVMGKIFFANKKDAIAKLRNYIAGAQTYYGQQIGKAQQGGMSNNADALQPFYYAAWLWLGDDQLLDLINIQQLEPHYDVKRLEACYRLHDLNAIDLWVDLVDMEGLEQEFLNHPWEGSDKFRTTLQDESSSSSFLDDQISVSTSLRRNMKLVTDESTIIPLPSVVINTPMPVRSTSLKY